MTGMLMGDAALLFDVDGTITPSHSAMDPDFKRWFLDLQALHPVYLVTGNDLTKTEAQVGSEVIDGCRTVFTCCGNEAWSGDQLLYRNSWTGTPELIQALEQELELASFPLRTGRHIEHKTGFINFSVLGRSADQQQRAQYAAYDGTRFERRSLIAKLGERFRDLEFVIAGEIGIDIYPRGRGKGQVLVHVRESQTLFFGDAIFLGGNDYDIAGRCTNHYHVQGWKQTWDLLKLISSK
jgi:HAD superfamily hydrolase (TIGR01484 family)